MEKVEEGEFIIDSSTHELAILIEQSSKGDHRGWSRETTDKYRIALPCVSPLDVRDFLKSLHGGEAGDEFLLSFVNFLHSQGKGNYS